MKAYTYVDTLLNKAKTELLRYGTIIDDARKTDENGNEHRYQTIQYEGLRYAIHKCNGIVLTIQSWDIVY